MYIRRTKGCFIKKTKSDYESGLTTWR